jgi:hypothetical protein
MSDSLELFKLKEKIKISYLKNRGDVIIIANELGLPLDYVQKEIKKLQKAEGRDVSILISHTLMSHILLGSKSRVTHLMEMLKSLESTEKPLFSICCDTPVETIEDSLEPKYKCLKCKKYCKVVEAPEVEIYAIKNEIIAQLREEDVTLVELAGKMGYTNKTEPPPGPVFKQNIIVMKGDRDKGETDPQIMQDIQQLPPMERERLLEKLKREMLTFNDGQPANPIQQ